MIRTQTIVWLPIGAAVLIGAGYAFVGHNDSMMEKGGQDAAMMEKGAQDTTMMKGDSMATSSGDAMMDGSMKDHSMTGEVQ